MSMSFADHFSESAARYAEFRPGYAPEMIARIAGLAPARDIAWDCGTGSGQAAALLAPHFDKVIATDPSDAQLAAAMQRPNIEYRLADECVPFLSDASVDLVTVAQALHWFERNGSTWRTDIARCRSRSTRFPLKELPSRA